MDSQGIEFSTVLQTPEHRNEHIHILDAMNMARNEYCGIEAPANILFETH